MTEIGWGWYNGQYRLLVRHWNGSVSAFTHWMPVGKIQQHPIDGHCPICDRCPCPLQRESP